MENPKFEIRNPPAAATLHFSRRSYMESHSLSLGAHLLLWVFPVALVVLVFLENALDGRVKDHRS